MKKKWLFVTCLFISVCINAQKDLTQYYIEQSEICGGIDSVMKKKGSWKKVEDAIVFADKTFPRTQYKFVNTRIDSMFTFFQRSIATIKWLRTQMV